MEHRRKLYFPGHDFYNRLFVENEYGHFGQAVREALSTARYNNVGSTDWIDIDSYDPELFSVDMFSADELLSEGNSYVFLRIRYKGE